MSGFNDISHKIERFESVESKYGVKLKSESAKVASECDNDGDYRISWAVEVFAEDFEIHQDLRLIVTTYSYDDRILKNETDYILCENFEISEIFSGEAWLSERPGKIRMMIKRG